MRAGYCTDDSFELTKRSSIMSYIIHKTYKAACLMFRIVCGGALYVPVKRCETD